MNRKARDVRTSWKHQASRSRTRTVTQTMLGRREIRERRGDAGLTGRARALGRSYAPGTHPND